MTVVEQGRRRCRDGLAFPAKLGTNLHPRGAGKAILGKLEQLHESWRGWLLSRCYFSRLIRVAAVLGAVS